MINAIPLSLTAASLLLIPSALANGFYPKSSSVLQVTGNTYDSLIANSNHTSIVEFYAPWCGHCQNLKPAYEKAAKSLSGLAKVAAVNCDDDINKALCGSMGVQGFPTLKLVKPGKKPGKPFVEDYRGPRTAKGISDAVVEKIPNHVRRLKDAEYQEWAQSNDRPKAILFSEKGTVGALLKAIAVDFLGAIDVAQVRDKEKQTVDALGVTQFPTLVLLPGGGKDAIKYDGEMKKEAMVGFLSQAAPPNPDPAPKKPKGSSSAKPSDKSKASKSSSSFAKASESHASSEANTAAASQTMETMEDDFQPTQSPDPNVVTDDTEKPVRVPAVAPPIASISETIPLQQKCLNTKSGTCVLALLPPSEDENEQTLRALASLSEIHHKHAKGGRNLFPFYQIPHTNPTVAELRSSLALSATEVKIIAVNSKRNWVRHYSRSSFAQAEVEDWIDEIRMGEGAKESLPAGLVEKAENLPPVEEPAKVKVDAEGESQDDLMEKLKAQMPEGMDFSFEPLDDDAYEELMAKGMKVEDEGNAHDEL